MPACAAQQALSGHMPGLCVEVMHAALQITETSTSALLIMWTHIAWFIATAVKEILPGDQRR